MKKISILSLSIFLIPFFAFAHPGRTDSSGCHTCRTNCPNWGLDTGEYHCHNAKAVPQPEEPVRSIYNANGAGTTIPAPEYKAPLVTPKVEEVVKPVPAKSLVSTSTTSTTSTNTTTSPSTIKAVEQPKSVQSITIPQAPEPQPVKTNWVKRFFGWLF